MTVDFSTTSLTKTQLSPPINPTMFSMFILLMASCFLSFISDMQVICSRHTCMLQQYFHLHQKRLDGNLTFISADPVIQCRYVLLSVWMGLVFSKSMWFSHLQ